MKRKGKRKWKEYLKYFDKIVLNISDEKERKKFLPIHRKRRFDFEVYIFITFKVEKCREQKLALKLNLALEAIL